MRIRKEMARELGRRHINFCVGNWMSFFSEKKHRTRSDWEIGYIGGREANGIKPTDLSIGGSGRYVCVG